MVNKKSAPNDLALRIATAMHQMGIAAAPRNYELVYEAYAGANPDLVRDFIALGNTSRRRLSTNLAASISRITMRRACWRVRPRSCATR